MAKCVLRCEKIKINDVGGVINHNLRKYENNEKAEHINQDRTIDNRISFGSFNVRNRLNEILETRKDNKKTIRKDAVVMMEFIVSASSEFFYPDLNKKEFNNLTMKDNPDELDEIFQTMDNSKLEEFEKVVIEWFKNEFGEENIVNINLHLDEKTPHFHCLIVPMTKDKRLSCKEIFTRDNARDWQTSFANSCKHLGLQRGVEYSGDVHTNQYTFNKGLIETNKIQPPEQKFELINKKEFLTLDDKQRVDYLLHKSFDLEKKMKFYKDFYDGNKDKISELNILREQNNKLIIQSNKQKKSIEMKKALNSDFSMNTKNSYTSKVKR